MSEGNYPRVLVITINPFNWLTGTGITMSNLFAGWPRERLAQIYLQDEPPGTDVCLMSRHIESSSAPFDHVVRQVIPRGSLGYAPETPGLALAQSDHASWKAWGHLMARALNDMSSVLLPASLRRWITNYSPDVIYSPLGSIRMMQFVLKVTKYTAKPMMPHFMDDWPRTKYSDNILFGLPRVMLNRFLRRVLHHAHSGLCISEEMADEYRRRYGLPFRDFMNCIDEQNFQAPSRHQDSKSASPVVSYIGGLHLNRWQSLRKIARAVERAGGELRIYAPPRDVARFADEFRQCARTRLASLAPTEVFDVLRQTDIAVHVESFEENTVEYTRLSVSTKIPQYLAVGKPILGFGPRQLASMHVIMRANAGVVIGEQDPRALETAVEKLFTDRPYRQFLGENGYAYARQRYLRSDVHEQFRQALCEGAWHHPATPSSLPGCWRPQS